MIRHTLLLRLQGPMQSWGTQSRFTLRDTATEPTKSGVIGLLCAALGRPREADIADLAALRMGVRVDRAGIVRRDFHTAGREGFMRASGKPETRTVVVSERAYLSDADFTVGLEGDDAMRPLLREVFAALRRPHWPLALGRKSFVPGAPVWIPGGLRNDTPLLEALTSLPLRRRDGAPVGQVRFAFEPAAWDSWPPELVRYLPDQPLSFAPRRFALRSVGIAHQAFPEVA